MVILFEQVRCTGETGASNNRLNFGLFQGPNELTIFCPEILFAVDGAGNTCTKPAWYDLLEPEVALNTVRDKGQHDWRRRIWHHWKCFNSTHGGLHLGLVAQTSV